MDVILDVSTGSDLYGPLPPGFHFQLTSGYTTLVGANNAGKSAILQLTFRRLNENSPSARDRTLLILPDRYYIDPTTETAGSNLDGYNQNLFPQLQATPLPSAAQVGPNRSSLTKLLLAHTDFIGQMGRLNSLLTRMGYPEMRLRGSQEAQFEEISVYSQGSGLRAVLPILAALTDTQLDAILIDEPELGLEPRLQKALRDLLIEEAATRPILVATHSHLLLNRAENAANHVVVRGQDSVEASPVSSDADMFDLVFRLLGNSTEDLFFPGNYVVVEGASDQEVVEHAIGLLGTPRGRIKVLSGGGIDAVRNTVTAVTQALVPLIVADSPYADRVVALVDEPSPQNENRVAELGNLLGERLFVLGSRSLEEYMPPELYENAGRNKTADLETIDRLKGDFLELRGFKSTVSRELAAAMSASDLDLIPTVRDAAQKAIDGL